MKIAKITILMIIVLGILIPAFGEEKPSNNDQRNTPITINLIIDGTQALSSVMNDVTSHFSNNLVDKILQNGDRLTIWSAGQTARILYSETINTPNDKENIKKILRNLPTQGDSADFSGALQAIQRSGSNIQLTMLASVSYTALSPSLLNSAAFRYSRVEEYHGWRVLVIAPDINERVRQAASAYFSGM